MATSRLSPAVARETPLVRRMTDSEADEVSRLFRRIVEPLPYYNDLAKSSELAKYTAEKLRASAKEDGDSVLVSVLDGRVVGFCISRFEDTLVWLSWFGVDSEARRLGVGLALLSALESTIRSRSAHKIWCDSRVNNEPSITALQKFGFSQICRVNNHWYGHDFYLWEKPVP